MTLLEGLLALKLVSLELHWPLVLLVRTKPWDVCWMTVGSPLVIFTVFIGGRWDEWLGLPGISNFKFFEAKTSLGGLSDFW